MGVPSARIGIPSRLRFSPVRNFTMATSMGGELNMSFALDSGRSNDLVHFLVEKNIKGLDVLVNLG
jgi:hypothetical protein